MASASDELKALRAAVTARLGREVKLFTSPRLQKAEPDVVPEASEEVADEFYELTVADYARLTQGRSEDKYLKTSKVREAELAERMSRIKKAVVRVQFPDGLVLEAGFLPADSLQCLQQLLQHCLRNPSLPYYLYTTPPKQRIRNFSQTMYTAGFAPGALVHLGVDAPSDALDCGPPYLMDDLLALKDMLLEPELPKEMLDSQSRGSAEDDEALRRQPAASVPAKPRVGTSTGKPKWFKR